MDKRVDKLPLMLPISKIVRDTPHHRTYFFDYELDFIPGQFVMMWLPRIDEKPFTLSYHDKKSFGVTVELKGKFTEEIFKLEKGDLIGFRGPYGNGYSLLKGKEVCIVAGGTGMATVSPLIEILKKNKCKVTIIQGSRSKEFLLYTKRFNGVEFCTDDGGFGHVGFVTEVLKDVLNKKKFDMVYTCGPEVMMKAVLDICDEHKQKCEVSLERYMRCGFGICGACVCGKERVCVDGPVFDNKKISQMEDFGKRAQIKSGHDVELKEYYEWRT